MRWIVPPFNARTTRDEDEGTLVFSAPGLNAISYTRTLSLSSSTFCVAVALAAFCCAIAEFTTAPANKNAGTSSPARTTANLLMISPFFRRKWRREPFYAPRARDREDRLRVRSVRPPGTLDRRSPHQPTLRRREIRARMGRAAVVPEEKVADAPDVLVDKLLLLGVVEHGLEQRVALFLRHVDNADGHQPVDVDGLAVGVLIGAEHRVDALAERFGAFVVTLAGRAIVVVMDGLASAELVAHRGIERVVGGIAAREQRIAAGVGNFDRVKHGRDRK